MYGVTIPGSPGIVIGFTRDVAWSLTNTGADVLDFYRETVDDQVHPTKYLVANFTISCAFAGLFGVFYSHYYGILTPAVMSTPKTIEILAIAYIGGRGSLWGPAIIAFPMSIAVELTKVQFSSLPGLYLVFYGLLLVLVMLFRPDGFAGIIRRLGHRIDGGDAQPTVPVPAPGTSV